MVCDLNTEDCFTLIQAKDDTKVLVEMDMQTRELSTEEARKMYKARYKALDELVKKCGCEKYV